MESAIELFAIFGGLDVAIDVTKSKTELICEHILQHYNHIDFAIKHLLLHDTNATKLLAALSVSDRRIFSSFKRARLNNINGGIALEFLQRRGVVEIELSREEDKRKTKPKLSREEARHRISDKFLIRYPFLRFWFYCIYPFAKEIEAGEYDGVLRFYEERKNSYTSLVFEELSRILLNYNLRDESIQSIASYWDANIEMDVLVMTQSNNIYAAECKWTNHKINKKELNRLKEKCESLKIEPKQFVLFSKRGFSKELMSLGAKDVTLYNVSDFQQLVQSKPEKKPALLTFL